MDKKPGNPNEDQFAGMKRNWLGYRSESSEDDVDGGNSEMEQESVAGVNSCVMAEEDTQNPAVNQPKLIAEPSTFDTSSSGMSVGSSPVTLATVPVSQLQEEASTSQTGFASLSNLPNTVFGQKLTNTLKERQHTMQSFQQLTEKLRASVQPHKLNFDKLDRHGQLNWRCTSDDESDGTQEFDRPNSDEDYVLPMPPVRKTTGPRSLMQGFHDKMVHGRCGSTESQDSALCSPEESQSSQECSQSEDNEMQHISGEEWQVLYTVQNSMSILINKVAKILIPKSFPEAGSSTRNNDNAATNVDQAGTSNDVNEDQAYTGAAPNVDEASTSNQQENEPIDMPQCEETNVNERANETLKRHAVETESELLIKKPRPQDTLSRSAMKRKATGETEPDPEDESSSDMTEDVEGKKRKN